MAPARVESEKALDDNTADSIQEFNVRERKHITYLGKSNNPCDALGSARSNSVSGLIGPKSFAQRTLEMAP